MSVRSPDDISVNYSGFTEFSKTRTSVTYPPKMDVPFVWDLYMDTELPLGLARTGESAATGLMGEIPSLIAGSPTRATTVASADTGSQPYGASATRDIELLSLMNDRLKQQSRRYPHPITNEMEDYQ